LTPQSTQSWPTGLDHYQLLTPQSTQSWPTGLDHYQLLCLWSSNGPCG